MLGALFADPLPAWGKTSLIPSIDQPPVFDIAAGVFCRGRKGLPLAIGVDRAPLYVDGGLEHLQAVPLQQFAPSVVVLLPGRHHGGQPQLLFEHPTIAVIVLEGNSWPVNLLDTATKA